MEGGQRSLPWSLSGTRSNNNWAVLSSCYWLVSMTATQKENLVEVESCTRFFLLIGDISEKIFPVKVLKLLTELDIYR